MIHYCAVCIVSSPLQPVSQSLSKLSSQLSNWNQCYTSSHPNNLLLLLPDGRPTRLSLYNRSASTARHLETRRRHAARLDGQDK
jgi:hypothetical protein